MKNAISWFEIPATNVERAQKFYETILQIQLAPLETDHFKMRMFPIDDSMNGVGGALVKSDSFHIPSATDGPLIYLNGNPDVQIILDRIEAAGGKIIHQKSKISDEYGYMAMFIDSEGNRIALHSVPEKYLSGNGS